MNPTPMTARRLTASGMTLMEVLIACGILVVGLASIAALLPAAGSRLSQANLEDRAGSVAANAYTDIVARRLLAADIFGDTTKSVAFGQGMSTLSSLAPVRFAVPGPELENRIDASRGFLLEDEVLYGPPTTAATPVNQFPQGRRAVKGAICWGATLVPSSFPAVPKDLPGTKATLSIAVFRKPPEPLEIRLTNKVIRPPTANEETLPDGLLAMETPSEQVMKKYLRSCSFVLVQPSAGAEGPRWFRVTAAWIMPIDPVTKQRLDPNCYVIFDDASDESITEFGGPTPSVIGFDGIVRLDEYKVILK